MSWYIYEGVTTMGRPKKPWQKQITPKLFEYCTSEISEYDNVDDYVAAVFESPVWETERVYKEGREEWLKSVWDAYHRSIVEIVEYTGLSKASFYRYFGIPRRTFQDWVYGINTAPSYTLFMIQEILGLVTRY